MPGLVDGHMHPLQGGAVLLKCNLNYERLTVAQFQERIQACLEHSRSKEPGEWLEVVNWFQQDMLPPGTELSARPSWVPAWDSLTDDERRLFARMMEADI